MSERETDPHLKHKSSLLSSKGQEKKNLQKTREEEEEEVQTFANARERDYPRKEREREREREKGKSSDLSIKKRERERRETSYLYSLFFGESFCGVERKSIKIKK